MKEIGGYFGLEEGNSKTEYYSSLIKLNLARNALAYILKARKIKKVYIPFFLCDTVYLTCKKEKIEYEFYKINKDFMPIFERKLESDEYIYIVNYFGQLTNNLIKKLSKKYKNVIVDNVQAFFQKPLKNIDTIYSCRKFFGVPDGAYLSSNKLLTQKLAIDDSSKRLAHLYGRKKDGASAHYNEYLKNEKYFYSLDLKKMSSFTNELVNKLDYRNIKKQRKRNFDYLNRHLKMFNLLKVKSISGAYCYPLIIKDAGKIRKKLIEKNIYVPLLWPNILDEETQEFSKLILPLPCDQRYTKNEMNIIVKEIKLCLKN